MSPADGRRPTESGASSLVQGQVDYYEARAAEYDQQLEYDFIFFAFWLSHVPASRFESFWRTVDVALAPSGRVVFIDEHAASAKREQEDWAGQRDDAAQRRLADRRSYRIAKAYLEPGDLQHRLAAPGSDLEIMRRVSCWSSPGRSHHRPG